MAETLKKYNIGYTGAQVKELLDKVSNGSVGGDLHIRQKMGPSNIWSYVHNLGKRPSVTLTDTDGNEFIADVRHINENEVIVNLGSSMTGYIILN